MASRLYDHFRAMFGADQKLYNNSTANSSDDFDVETEAKKPFHDDFSFVSSGGVTATTTYPMGRVTTKKKLISAQYIPTANATAIYNATNYAAYTINAVNATGTSVALATLNLISVNLNTNAYTTANLGFTVSNSVIAAGSVLVCQYTEAGTVGAADMPPFIIHLDYEDDNTL